MSFPESNNKTTCNTSYIDEETERERVREMPLGKYYCDYCDKEFQDTQYARKRHLQGLHHIRNKALWFDSFQSQGLCFFFSFSLSVFQNIHFQTPFYQSIYLWFSHMLTRLIPKDLAKGSATALSRRYLFFENLSLNAISLVTNLVLLDIG